jgi:hypothetical protein
MFMKELNISAEEMLSPQQLREKIRSKVIERFNRQT